MKQRNKLKWEREGKGGGGAKMKEMMKVSYILPSLVTAQPGPGESLCNLAVVN